MSFWLCVPNGTSAVEHVDRACVCIVVDDHVRRSDHDRRARDRDGASRNCRMRRHRPRSSLACSIQVPAELLEDIRGTLRVIAADVLRCPRRSPMFMPSIAMALPKKSPSCRGRSRVSSWVSAQMPPVGGEGIDGTELVAVDLGETARRRERSNAGNGRPTSRGPLRPWCPFASFAFCVQCEPGTREHVDVADVRRRA